MTQALTSPQARMVIGAALLLGIAADLLLREMPAQLGMTIWVLIAVGVALLVARDRLPARSVERRDAFNVAALMALGAFAFFTTDAEPLYLLSFLSMLCLAALLAWTLGRRREVATIRLRDLPVAVVGTGLSSAFGVPALAFKDGALESPSKRSGARGRVSMGGVIVAVPVVLIAGLLLASADPVFEALLSGLVDAAVARAFEHLAVIGFYAWCTAGWLRAFFAPIASDEMIDDAHVRPAEGLRLLMPTLYLLAALVALFLAVQARALFGGASYVEATSGMTYAEYARRGVFGLVLVAGIVLAGLVAGGWLVDRKDAGEVKRYQGTGWVLIGLVATLIASAGQRMALYVDFYGLSTMRVYAIAATAVVAVAFVLCALTVMRLRGERFAVGVLAACGATLILLHVVNPERLVVRVNVDRALAGEGFDTEYHVQLSADAVPALIAAAARMPREQCVALATSLHAAWTERLGRRSEDWRRWNAPLARARRLFAPPPEEALRSWCA